MGVGSICGLIGTLLSIITLVLITVASIVPRFVDVYLVSDAEQIEEDNPVAGIGIFQSFYDSDRVDPEVLDASGAPVDDFTSPTPDFNLLFRARENFLLDILPVNAEVAADLAAAVNNSAVEALILSLLQPIIDIEFVDCDQYINEAFTTTEALFAGLQNPLVQGQPSVLEGAIDVISDLVGTAFNGALQGIALFTTAGTTNPLEAVYTGVVSEIAATCGVPDLDTTTLNAEQVTCFVGALDATNLGTLNFFISAALSDIFESCEGQTVLACLSGFDFLFDSFGVADFQSPQTFGAATGANNVCGALQNVPGVDCDPGTTNHVEFLQIYAGVLLEISALEGAALGFGLFLAGVQRALLGAPLASFSFTTTIDASIDLGALTSDIPVLFTDAYPPCDLILLLDGASEIEGIQGECTFANYFVGAASALAAAGSDLADLVGDLGLLYGGCASAVADVNNATAGCPLVFGQNFVALGVGFEVGDSFADNALQACEDELTDLEKVEEAQNLLIGSYPFYFISTIAAVVAVALASSATFLYGIAAASSFLAGILTLTALLVVQSAPIYDEVGEEPNGEDVETFFVSGPVQLLAIMCFLLMFVSGGFFVGASILLCLEGDSSDEDIEVKGDKQDVAVYAAAADAEPVPAKENPTVTDVGTGKDVSI